MICIKFSMFLGLLIYFFHFCKWIISNIQVINQNNILCKNKKLSNNLIIN